MVGPGNWVCHVIYPGDYPSQPFNTSVILRPIFLQSLPCVFSKVKERKPLPCVVSLLCASVFLCRAGVICRAPPVPFAVRFSLPCAFGVVCRAFYVNFAVRQIFAVRFSVPGRQATHGNDFADGSGLFSGSAPFFLLKKYRIPS